VIRRWNGVDRALLICEFCGCEIGYPEKRCAALEDGKCRPWIERQPRGPVTVSRLRRPPAAHRL